MSARGVPVRRGYESIPRALLQPEPGAMSARALGLLCHMLSRPAGWRFSAERLSVTFTEGRGAVETALQELERLGYLARRKVRGARGRFGWVWLYADDPEYLTSQLEAALAGLDAAHG